MLTSWEQMTRRDQLAATHYDFYKDVHGIRPRWFNYDAMTERELEEELDRLEKEAEIIFARKQEDQKRAIEAFERHVTNTICMGARDRETALRWIMDASLCGGDWEFLCYDMGLPYGYFKKTVN